MDNIEDRLLAKWLDGSITQDEKVSLSEAYDLDYLEKLLGQQNQFQLAEKPESELWDNLEPQLNPKSSSRKWMIYLALAALIATLSFWLINFKSTAIKSKQAQNKTYLLADNSEVILSPNSQIVFQQNGFSKKRTVELSGQALFKVQKGGSFIVSMPQGKVHVLGTSFEIWEKGNQMKVNCLSGKVAVINNQGKKVELTKSEGVFLNNQSFSAVNTLDNLTAEFLSDKVKYQQIGMAQFKEEIERFYEKEIVLKDVDLEKSFSGVLVLNDFDKAISYIAQTMNWKYELFEQKVILSPK